MMIRTIEEALAALGVTDSTLSEAEKAHLDEFGYLILEDAIPPALLAEMQAAYDLPTGHFALRPGDCMNDEDGGGRHTNMEYIAPVFDHAYVNPRHLAAAYHIFKGPFRLFTINGRDPKLGKGHQHMHRDVGRTVDRRPLCVQSLWMLDDFTVDNGSTRIVPGTHRQDDAHWVDLPPRADCLGPVPGEIRVLGRAGSIAVFNSTLMHGGTENRSGARRRTLHATFSAEHFTGHFPHQQWITPDMYDRISPAARFLLHVTERPTARPEAVPAGVA